MWFCQAFLQNAGIITLSRGKQEATDRPEVGSSYMVANFNGEYVNMGPVIFPFPIDLLEMASFSSFSFQEVTHSDGNISKMFDVYIYCSSHARPLVGTAFCISASTFPWRENSISMEKDARNVTDASPQSQSRSRWFKVDL